MKFIQALSLLVALCDVSSFVPQFSHRKIPVVSAAAKRRPWKGFLEKQGDGNDSQVLIEKTNEDTHSVDVDMGVDSDMEADEDIVLTSHEAGEEDEAAVTEKDEQTLFDEMNMQKAIQLVVDWYVKTFEL